MEEKKESCAIRQGEHGGSLCSLEAARSDMGALEGGGVDLVRSPSPLAAPGWRIPPRASAPDGSSPGAMSWPGHFLSKGLVLIKARANSNAPFFPLSLLLLLFFILQPLSTLTPSNLAERLKTPHISLSTPLHPEFLLFVSLSRTSPFV